MIKEEILNISDGHLYKSNDMAKLGCHECSGCSDCCKDMDQSIVLDPYDIYMLCNYKKLTFGQLLNDGIIELHLENGLLLPNIRMVQKSANLAVSPECSFLDKDGRCSVHSVRPGVCRLFPLGRNYDENGLSYFVLKDGCSVKQRQKVKINKWLGISNLKEYEKFLIDWHDIRGAVRSQILEAEDEQYASAITTGFLKLFYEKPYEEGTFFNEFTARVSSLI